jgi:hypothetical protein
MVHPDKERRRKGASKVVIWINAKSHRAHNGLVILQGQKSQILAHPGRFSIVTDSTGNKIVTRRGSIIRNAVGGVR